MIRSKLFWIASCITSLVPVSSFAATFWKPFEGNTAPSEGEQVLKPDHFRLYTLDQGGVSTFLHGLSTDPERAVHFSMPSPDGRELNFVIWETPLMAEGLQSRYSGIRTFTARSVDHPEITAKIDYTAKGFHAMVYDQDQTYFIDPYTNVADGYYAVYYKKDYVRSFDKRMECHIKNDEDAIKDGKGVAPSTVDGSIPPMSLRTNGTTKKTYRLALSCTGEYAIAVAGPNPTKAGVLSAMVTTMNRVNGIYERELAISMSLIANNDTLIYLNPATDPFSDDSDGYTLLDETQPNTVSVIGDANYDIGHIFSTGGGGVAIKSVCENTFKASGVTGSPYPIGDGFDVDYVAHEMGHQFGAVHTMNMCSSPSEQYFVNTAYEPGSGTTIMGYAGICAQVNNVQMHSDAYFHSRSLEEITTYVTSAPGNTCGATQAGSQPPVLPSIVATYSIPFQTPFEIQAPVSTAAQSDSLLYCWEEWDLGDLRKNENLGGGFTQGPALRSFFPTRDRTRVFPKLESVLNNVIAYKGERLSTVARTSKFKLCVRNILNGWGTFNLSEEVVTANVINTGVPFKVTFPNAATDTFEGNKPKTITWDIAQTNAAPINTTKVDVFLSVDGGYTYPYTLATAIPNSGSASVVVPDTATIKARIKVKGSGNIFFDLSDKNFVIKKTNILSVSDLALENDIAIYPNPASDNITVRNQGTGKLNVTLYSVVGQRIWNAEMTKQINIPVNNYSRGMYFLQVNDEEKGGKLVKRISLK